MKFATTKQIAAKHIAALGAACMLGLTGTAAAAAAVGHPAARGAKEYANCTALNKVYPHGVGKPGARDKTSGTPVTNFTRNLAVYNANTKSDRDKDGIACETK